MSTLDFQDREPDLDRAGRTKDQVFSGNSALFERLQGQRRKGALERYGWIAVPVAAVAIIGVVAVTSTPHQSADDVVGAPGRTAAASAPAPAKPVTPPVNEALANNDAAQTPAEAALSGKDSATANSPSTADKSPAATDKSPAAAPAPVRVARKAAPAHDTASARPAAAAPAERSAPAPAPAPAAHATQEEVPQASAPQVSAPAAPAPSTDDTAAQAPPSQSAPAEAAPAQ